MKNKVFVFFVLAVLFLPFVLSDIATTIGDNVQKAQDVKTTIDQSSDTQYWQEKWDYLSGEWKTIFLKNPVVAAFDSFFTQISIVFLVLFGVQYSLSLVLLVIVILWIYLFFNLSKIIKATGFLPGAMSYAGSTLLLVILAQFKTFEVIVVTLGRLAFSPSYIWTRLIILFVIFGSFALFAYLDKKLSTYLILKRKAAKERSAEISKKAITSFAENLASYSKLGDKK